NFKTEYNNGAGIYIRNYSALYPTIFLNNAEVYNSNTNNSSSPKYGGSAINIMTDTNDTNTNDVGNIKIIRPKVVDSRATKQIIESIFVRSYASERIDIVDVDIIDPLQLDRSADTTGIQFYGAGQISDLYNILEHDLIGNAFTLVQSNFRKT